jgi:uridylate kinase
MDRTAAAMAGDRKIPIFVFDFAEPDNVRRIVLGESVGTVIGRNEHAG